MADALFELFFRLPIVLVAELIAILILIRMRVRHRLRWIIGSYLLLVAAALAFGLIGRDDFGFGFIPLIVMTAPWQLLPLKLPQSVFTDDLVQIAFGLLLNCVLFYILDYSVILSTSPKSHTDPRRRGVFSKPE